MSKGQIFTADLLASLYDPPISKRGLIRHYTLQPSDLVHICRCRADHNRLVFAVMLCYLRYPGPPLLEGEQPPRETVEFSAEQIDVLPGEMDLYLEQDRRRHYAILAQHNTLQQLAHRKAIDNFVSRWR